jgi:hypothetical protein
VREGVPVLVSLVVPLCAPDHPVSWTILAFFMPKLSYYSTLRRRRSATNKAVCDSNPERSEYYVLPQTNCSRSARVIYATLIRSMLILRCNMGMQVRTKESTLSRQHAAR